MNLKKRKCINICIKITLIYGNRKEFMSDLGSRFHTMNKLETCNHHIEINLNVFLNFDSY